MAEDIRTELHPLKRRWNRRRLQDELQHLRKETHKDIDDIYARLRALESD